MSKLTYDELLELSMEIDDKFRQIKKLNKKHIAKINRLELEVGMLKDENIISEEELELSQEKNKCSLVENETISIDFGKVKLEKDNLLKENTNLKSNIETLKVENLELKEKLDKITNNVSKFNKGKQDLENLIKTSKPPGNRNGIGFKNIPKQKGNNIKKYSFIYQKTKECEKNTKNIKIWIPKTNNNFIREKLEFKMILRK